MNLDFQDAKVQVVSDVSNRDGIGIEVFLGQDCVLEIFRDDMKRTREITLYREELPLELIEKSIALFRAEIPWNFIE
jgi:hypothetical protein